MSSLGSQATPGPDTTDQRRGRPPSSSPVPDSPAELDRRRHPAPEGDAPDRRRRATPAMSVIVPTFNESGNMPELVERLQEALGEYDYEVIIVDDDSPDLTWKVATEITEDDYRFTVIRRTTDRGLSSAVLTGMTVAKGDVLVVMDGDLQHDPATIPGLVAEVNGGVDVAVASRGVDGGSYGEFSTSRRLISWVGARMAQTLLRTSISDPMSGFFALDRDRYETVVNEVNPRGFKILLEFLARGGRPTVAEVGYRFGNRTHGTTKMSSSIIVAYLLAMIELSAGRFVSATFTAYSLVGLLGLSVRSSAQWLLERDLFSGILQPDWAVLLAVEVSVISNYLIHNLFTFASRRHLGWERLRGALWFHIVSVYGLMVHAGAMALFGEHSPDGTPWSLARLWAVEPSAAFLFGLAMALIGNYHLNSTVTWRRPG